MVIMGITFTNHLGSEERDNVMRAGLISDGKTLALGFHERFVVVRNFKLSNLMFTKRWDGITELDFTVVSKDCESIYNTHEVRSIFQNAADLSVDELLKLAYQRMDQRPS